jgi:threonine/homoserine/homoserine lactone efflux protein
MFLSATVMLNAVPGADVLYVASQSLISKKNGIIGALGICTGISVYVIATTFGLAEILRLSPVAFNVIKFGGAFYLAYLGWHAIAHAKEHSKFNLGRKKKYSLFQSYYKGIFTTLLNPKVGLFFVTFLPQFTSSQRGEVWIQLLALGTLFVVLGLINDIIYVFLFGYLKKNLFTKHHAEVWFNRITGVIFCILAFKILIG